MKLACNLERFARLFPNHVALIQGGEQATYAQPDLRAARITSGLHRLWSKPGDLAALCAPNSTDWPAFYFGVVKL